MTTLILRRIKTAWQDIGRNYRLMLDDQEVAQVANGEEIEISISEGKHVVQMQIDWCQSEALKLDVSIGETQILECGPNAKPWLALLYVTVLRSQYLWLRRVNPSSK